MDNGSTDAPTCVAQSYTGETNNLNFGPTAPTANPGALPAVVLTESSAGGALSSCAGATSVGDTHLTTIAGTHYDFQASGDFLLAQAGPNFVVHTRQQSGAPTWPNVSVNKAVAARLGRTSVASCAAPMRLLVGGKPNNLADGKSLSLPDGVAVSRNGDVFVIKAKNGDGVRAQVNHTPSNDWIDVTIGLGDNARSANVHGLLGNPQDNSNEIATREGTVLRQPISFEELYRRYGGSWRLPPEQSLLRCQEVRPGIPARPFYANDLTPEQFAQARAICASAGVRAPAALDDCTLDVTVLGNRTAAGVFVHAPTPVVVIKPGERSYR